MKKIFYPSEFENELYAVDPEGRTYHIKPGDTIEVSEVGFKHLVHLYKFLVEAEAGITKKVGPKEVEKTIEKEIKQEVVDTKYSWGELLKMAREKGVYKMGMNKEQILKALNL